MNKPVLFCYDGSEGSKTALGGVVDLIKPGDAVVLVVWTRAIVQLARAGSFLVDIPNEGEIDDQEAARAQQIAEEGAADARRRGYNASALVAQEIDAGLIVCGQRGRGALRSAVLGSVSHALASHTKRPLLIAPQHPS